MRQLYGQYGVSGLFTGLVPRVIKVAPACAIMIATFEHGKIAFNRLANISYPSSAVGVSAEPSSESSTSFSSSSSIRGKESALPTATNKGIIRDLTVSTHTDVL